MSDQFDEVVQHVKTPSTWLRILFMLGFCVILYVVGVVIMVLTATQVLFAIFSGSDNGNLRRLGKALTDYVTQLLRFITYNSEERPFPFAPFPEVEAAPPADDSPESAPDPTADSAPEASAESASTSRKTPRKPSTRKKAAPAADPESGATDA
ncbi:MAG: hypothetical protein RLZZ385_2351 [Pseudomonadota bacterium]|jgi:hypothetical protein